MNDVYVAVVKTNWKVSPITLSKGTDKQNVFIKGTTKLSTDNIFDLEIPLPSFVQNT